MENLLKIGIIVKPQGVKGELKVMPLTDDCLRFKKLKKIIIDNRPIQVTSVRTGCNEVFLTLMGITDRNAAEQLRSKFLYIERQDAVTLPKDSYFIADIIGCKIKFSGEREFGEITDVTEAKTDYFTAALNNGKTVRFPFLKDVALNVDVLNKVITLDEKRFFEVAVYED